ncbi:MAG: sigma-54-dependent Fis family transcriptional regulator [Mailhella sp.]|nr:sigma-54-dependent Fis family transcriptional regulator [Mailhella sp.]
MRTNLTEDALKETGLICARLYGEWGADQMSAFLDSWFSLHMPQVHHFHFSVRSREADMMQQAMSVLSEKGSISTVILQDKQDFSNLDGDDLEDRVISDITKDPVFRNSPNKAGCRSFLRVKVFEDGTWVCFFGLWAYEAGAFSDKTLSVVRRLMAPLGEEMRHSFQSNTGQFRQILSYLPEMESPLTKCPGMRGVLSKIEKVADTDVPVLIVGETGTGKTLAARLIHERSRRAKLPFLRVNCGAVPESLFESEFFGYERGAFTGAQSMHKGYFEQAGGGTLFLDEIGELSSMAQAKLLHVLDEREVTRIGGTRRIPVSARVLAATNRDLEAMVREGTFRSDLFFRLCVYDIFIPPLRRRPGDIPILAKNFIASKSKRFGQKGILAASNDDFPELMNYTWPGNVRELEHVIERALIDSIGKTGSSRLHFRFSGIWGDRENAAVKNDGGVSAQAPQASAGAIRPLDEVVAEHVAAAVKQCGGKIYGPEGAAAKLGMHPITLKNHCRRLGLSIAKNTEVKTRSR